MQNFLKYFFVATLVLLLFLPAIQFQFNLPPINNTWLAGKTEEVSKPVFDKSAWFDETYQKNAATYLESKAGYRSWMVRFTNEWQFRFFNDAANNVIVGKEGWLYLKQYIESYTGKDLANYEDLSMRVSKAKMMQSLFDSAGKKALFIIAPGKASYMSEYIPDHYLPAGKPQNNYQLLKAAFEKEQIEYIDLYQFFLSQKTTSPYPLFPKYGTHWSLYGGFVAMDSIAHYLSVHSDLKLPKYELDRIETSSKPRGTDKDLQDLMNIFSELPSPQLAYPLVSKRDSAIGTTAPGILVIGDSYMWTFYQTGIMPLIAGKNTRYWYYGNTVYDYNIQPTGIETKNLNMGEEIQKTDIVLFVFTETGQINIDFNLAETFITSLQTKINERH